MAREKKEYVETVIRAPRGSIYLSVLQELALGQSVAATAKKLRIAPGYVFGIRRSAQKRAERMAANEWADDMRQRAKEAIMLGMLVPEAYPMGKLGVSALKGLGDFRVGEASPPPPAISNTTIYQTVQILMTMSPEEREKLREQYRQHALHTADSGPGIVRSIGVGASEDQDGPAVVAEELHSDL